MEAMDPVPGVILQHLELVTMYVVKPLPMQQKGVVHFLVQTYTVRLFHSPMQYRVLTSRHLILLLYPFGVGFIPMPQHTRTFFGLVRHNLQLTLMIGVSRLLG